jgi:hypothetical protein
VDGQLSVSSQQPLRQVPIGLNDLDETCFVQNGFYGFHLT